MSTTPWSLSWQITTYVSTTSGAEGRTDGQKLSCTFTLDVPGLGYLEGGTEADVRLVSPIRGPDLINESAPNFGEAE